MDDMVFALKKEQADEVKQKDFCVEEFRKNQLQTEEKTRPKRSVKSSRLFHSWQLGAQQLRYQGISVGQGAGLILWQDMARWFCCVGQAIDIGKPKSDIETLLDSSDRIKTPNINKN